jgi:hypothetical protein
MALTKVYPAPGRTVRDENRQVVPATGADVDLDTVFWHRRLKWGDVVLEQPAQPSAPPATPAGTADFPSPAKAAAAPAPSSSKKGN